MAQPQQAPQQQQPLKYTQAELINCRMYEQKFPEVDEMVVVTVKRIADMGVYVTLLEYNNIEGMIIMSEISRRRIRSIKSLLRVGKQEVVSVVRVDKEKGYIDLSKRRVSTDEAALAEEKFNKSKAVHSIMRHFAEIRNIPLESLNKKYVWPLYRRLGHAYEGFRQVASSIEHAEAVWGQEGAALATDPEFVDLVDLIKRRMTPQPMKIRADVKVSCAQYEGIDSIKAALAAGEKCGSEACPVNIRLVATPNFVLFTTSLDRQQGVALLQQAIEAVRKEITARGGELVVVQAPRSITDHDDRQFSMLLQKLDARGTGADGAGGNESGDESGSDTDGEGEPKKGAAAGPAAAAPAAGGKKGEADDEGDDDVKDSDGEQEDK